MKDMTSTPWRLNGKEVVAGQGDQYEIVSYSKRKDSEAIVSAVNGTYGIGIDPGEVAGLLSALENLLLDAEPMKGGEQVSIPAVSIKLIKSAIKKAKIVNNG